MKTIKTPKYLISKKKMNNYKRDHKIWNKKAQVTIFIIIAIVLVLSIVLFFVIRGGIKVAKIPKDLEPAYTYYLDCIEQETETGVMIMGQQAGYIETPEFSPGNTYMPFSSQLDFLGTGVPYWYYISGNGLAKEQVPTKEKMQEQLNDYLEEKISGCDFSSFRETGFEIDLDDKIEVKTKIKGNKINVDIIQNLAISTETTSWIGEKHSKKINSNLGNFYNSAIKIYNDFKENMFLENYGVDILRLYAPVDGVDIACKPSIWSVEQIRENLTQALESNIPFTKIKGDYYDLKSKENKYFVQDIGKDIDANVNFMFLREWPNKMEVWPNEQGLLMAEPVGLQEGLGMLGFCYVPYHFVYDLAYPVLIQVYFNEEIFQFPVVVYINKNKPREPIDTTNLPNVVPELCLYKNTQISVSTYNINLEPIPANIKFKCLATTCDIGRTEAGILTDNFPQCGNGYIIASAEGYKTKKQLLTTINPGTIDIFLDREYELNLEIAGIGTNDFAVITFKKDKATRTIAYPDQKQVTLSEGQYEIKAFVYSDAEINLQGSSEQKCIDVPRSGVLGILGFQDEKCFNLEVPSQTVDTAVSGGGTQNYYITESELETSNKIIIMPTNFGRPTKIQDLQLNYNSIEVSRLNIRLE